MKRLIIIVFILMLTGCTTTKYVEVPTTKTEYNSSSIKDSLSLKDSIYVRDSIFIYTVGDTVTKIQKSYVYKDKIIYQDRIIKDTVIVRDSIPKIITVEKEKSIFSSNKIIPSWLMCVIVILIVSIGIKKLLN